METQAYIKYVKTSPKKLRFMVDDVKKMTPQQALNSLLYSPKRSAKILYKVVKSAVDNAKSAFKVDAGDLRFKALVIEQGPALKRMRPGSKGRANLYKRRSSHIKVVVTVNGPKIKTTEGKVKAVPKLVEKNPKTDKKPVKSKPLAVAKKKQ